MIKEDPPFAFTIILLFIVALFAATAFIGWLRAEREERQWRKDFEEGTHERHR